jgi:hypothetical protein
VTENSSRRQSSRWRRPRSRTDAIDPAISRRSPRLVPVDAGIDAAALRRVYADRRRYIIAPATIRIALTTEENEPRISGNVAMVTDSLVVPRRWRDVLDSVSQGPEPYGHQGPPRYTATIAYGRRFEPWIVSIERIDTPSPPH